MMNMPASEKLSMIIQKSQLLLICHFVFRRSIQLIVCVIARSPKGDEAIF